MILYLESSSLISLYLREGNRHDTVTGLVRAAQMKYVSPLALVEVRSGLARARFKDNPPRLRAAGYARSLNDFMSDWPQFFQVGVQEEVLERAASFAEKHRLRAYDAVHLAAAMQVKGIAVDTLLISTWDRELAAAAEAEGLSLAHEVTT